MLEKDLEAFRRRLNLRIFFAGTTESTPSRSLLAKVLPSTWNPPDALPTNDPEWVRLRSSLDRALKSRHRITNISKPVESAWKELISHKDFYLLPADKGGKLVIWARERYLAEAHRQLSDSQVYAKIPPESMTQATAALLTARNSLIMRLFWSRNISRAEKDRALAAPWKLPRVYFLPKAHKDKRPDTGTFQGRPIIAQTNGPLSSLDRYLAFLTAPILTEIPGSLIDTSALLKAVNNISGLGEGDTLFSADVEALYPSIPWEEGLQAATRLFASRRDALVRHCQDLGCLPPPSPALFSEILGLVIRRNYFSFQGTQFYHQLSGTAMGASMSVFFANAFMYYRSQGLIHNPPPELVFLGRYIDDFVGIWRGDPGDIPKTFGEVSHGSIRLTFVLGDPDLAALDVKLRILPDGGIHTSLYRKPTDGHQFVHWRSAHPRHLKSSLPYSQLLRIRRICSSESDFRSEALHLLDRFRTRGYPEEILTDAFTKACASNRLDLLAPKPTSQAEDSVTLVTDYHPILTQRIRRISRAFYAAWSSRECWRNMSPPLPTAPPRLGLRVPLRLSTRAGRNYKEGPDTGFSGGNSTSPNLGQVLNSPPRGASGSSGGHQMATAPPMPNPLRATWPPGRPPAPRF